MIIIFNFECCYNRNKRSLEICSRRCELGWEKSNTRDQLLPCVCVCVVLWWREKSVCVNPLLNAHTLTRSRCNRIWLIFLFASFVNQRRLIVRQETYRSEQHYFGYCSIYEVLSNLRKLIIRLWWTNQQTMHGLFHIFCEHLYKFIELTISRGHCVCVWRIKPDFPEWFFFRHDDDE